MCSFVVYPTMTGLGLATEMRKGHINDENPYFENDNSGGMLEEVINNYCSEEINNDTGPIHCI